VFQIELGLIELRGCGAYGGVAFADFAERALRLLQVASVETTLPTNVISRSSSERSRSMSRPGLAL